MIEGQHMKTIYCISGLGATAKAFSKLSIEGYQLQVIEWLQPLPKETIEAYAIRMRAYINEDNPILMGLSFGGVMCIEIARQIPVQKVILISSVKSRDALPAWMKAVAALKLNRIFPVQGNYKLTQPVQNYFLGVSNAEEKQMVGASRKQASQYYVRWAVDKIVNWKNDWQHPALVHIHGSSDKIFPCKKAQPHFTIKNGGHLMIMNKAAEVSACIQQCL
jgi:esterase/lipase